MTDRRGGADRVSTEHNCLAMGCWCHQLTADVLFSRKNLLSRLHYIFVEGFDLTCLVFPRLFAGVKIEKKIQEKMFGKRFDGISVEMKMSRHFCVGRISEIPFDFLFNACAFNLAK